MGVFIGLDVSLAKTAICVVDRDGIPLSARAVDRDGAVMSG